jgi:hypothetical protein
MGKYQEREEKMKSLIENINRKIDREGEKSVIIQSQNYRAKQETIQAFEVVESEAEKHGNLLWYNKLRDYSKEEDKFEPGAKGVR